MTAVSDCGAAKFAEPEHLDAMATVGGPANNGGVIQEAAAHATSRLIAKAMGRILVDPARAQCAPQTFLPPRLDNIPQELRERARWVWWRCEGAQGQKPKKVPYSPALHNSRAASNDPATWGTFAQAEAACAEGGVTGLGFMLNNDGIVGIGIDKCVVDGVIKPNALALMETLGVTYVEPPPDLVEWVKACRIAGVGDIAEFQADVLHDVRPIPTIIPISDAARMQFKALEVHCNVRMDELDCMGVSEMYTRVREIAMRVSLIVAHSCGATAIEAEHAQWAIDYVCFWADRAIKSLAANVADSPFAALCNDVYNSIQKAGGQGLTVAELSRKSAKFKAVDGRMRKLVFDNLAADHGVQLREFKPASGRGQSRIVYLAAKFLD